MKISKRYLDVLLITTFAISGALFALKISGVLGWYWGYIFFPWEINTFLFIVAVSIAIWVTRKK